MAYILRCKSGHKTKVMRNELWDHLDENRCPICTRCFVKAIPESIPVRCPCGYREWMSLEEATGIATVGCPNADPDFESPATLPYHRLAIEDTSAALFYDYEWGTIAKSHQSMSYKDMGDYWEYLVHFTDETGFLNIINSGTIEARQAGLYHRRFPKVSKSVCLTEAPLDYANRFFENYGPYGFVFHKADLHPLGALPIMHVTHKLLGVQRRKNKGFADALKPYVQLVRTEATGGRGPRYDWIHDREWRVPKNIDLNITKPIGIVFKDPIRFSSDGDFTWETKIRAAMRYGEVTLK